MRKYEIMMIISPELDERQVTPRVEKYLELITNNGGSVDEFDLWGKRRLATEINKKTEGIYLVLKLTSTPADVQELNRQFSINEQIMRTKVFLLDK